MSRSMIDFIVCVQCGHMWPIAKDAADPDECRRCDSAAMWRFTDRGKANLNAHTIRNLRRES